MIEVSPQNIESYREKIEFLNQLADKNSSNREKYYNLAIECYDKIIGLNPNYAEAYKGKADTYCRKNDYNLAIKCYDKVIELNPNEAKNYKGKADAYCQLADKNSSNREKYYNLAIKCYDKAIKLKPSSELYYGKSNALNRLNRESEAEECMRIGRKLRG